MNLSKGHSTTIASCRQRQIEDCLYHSLLQRPYTSVSISDLCHQLEISRKSFYNYYPDKDSCFRAIISRKLRQCLLQMTSLPGDAAQDEIILTFLNFWRQERNLLDIIVRNNLLYMSIDQCILFVRDEDRSILNLLNTPRMQNDAYVLSTFVTANITLLIHWYMKGFDTSPEEMVNKYKRIIFEPLVGGSDPL